MVYMDVSYIGELIITNETVRKIRVFEIQDVSHFKWLVFIDSPRSGGRSTCCKLGFGTDCGG